MNNRSYDNDNENTEYNEFNLYKLKSLTIFQLKCVSNPLISDSHRHRLVNPPRKIRDRNLAAANLNICRTRELTSNTVSF